MSEIKVNKISPRAACGTVTLGDSGDTITIPAGAIINNQGTATNFGATGAVSWNTTVKTTTFTAVAGEGYFINTTGGEVTVNLPAGVPGNIIGIQDYAGTFDTNKLLINSNGSEKIQGSTDNYQCKIKNATIYLLYQDATKGWTADNIEVEITSLVASGGTEITAGGYKYHTFTGSGNLTVTTSIETYTDGWYRIISRVQGSASNSLASGFRFGFGDPSNGSQQYTNIDDEVLVYGAQLENGSFATSYIPSADSSGSVNRQPDLGKIIGENFSSFFNASEGTFDVGYKLGGDNSSMRVAQVSNGTSNNVIDLVVGSGGGQGGYWFINTGGTTQFSSTSVTNSSQVDRNFRAVLAYKENDCAAQSNKITAGPTTDTNVTLATDYDRLSFYQIANNGDHIQGHLKFIRYYPKRLTNAQVTLFSQD